MDSRLLIRATPVLVLVLVAALAPVIVSILGLPHPNAVNIHALGPLSLPLGPSSAHPFGVDNLGRDVLSRVLYGARTAVVEVVVATALTGAVAFLLRAAAGNRYLAALIDDLLGLLDLLPAIVLGLLLWIAGVQPSAFLAVAVLIMDALPSAFLRFRRGPALPRIVLERVAIDLMVLVALAFFGLGGGAVSWGGMAAGAIDTIKQGINAWWWLLAPAVAITGAIAALRHLADAFPHDQVPEPYPLTIGTTLTRTAGIVVAYCLVDGRIPPLGLAFGRLAGSLSLLLGAAAIYVLGALVISALPVISPRRTLRIAWQTLVAVPVGVLAALAVWLFASDVGRFPWLPGAGRYVGLTSSPGEWLHALLLPWASLVVVFAASRVITIDRSFDRAGRASGVTSAVVVRRRLRLSLARLLAFPARWCSVLISAALVVEAVFSVPGVGMLAQASVASGHRRSAEGAVLLAALLVPAALVVMALGRLAIDPRQRR